MIYTFEFDFEDFFGPPQIRIGIDDYIYYDGTVKGTIDIELNLVDGDHVLWIQHYGKDITWTTKEHDNHVLIRRISFDGVDLDQIDYRPITHRGKFYPEYESSYQESCRQRNINLPEFISPNHYLGHNGTWRLEFSTPELLWIIKQQNPSGIHLEDTIFSTGQATLERVKHFFDL